MKISELPKNALVLIQDADNISYSISHEMKKWDDDINLANSLINDYMNNLLSKVGCSHFIGFVGGKGNFRYEIAKTKPYKGNRGERSERDEYWKQYVSEFLVNNYSLTRVNGIESDDAVSIIANELEQLGINYLIASNDKDLDQVTGNHCKFDMSGPTKFYHVNEYQASTNLAYQMIIGDSTDNIPGVPGRGKIWATQYLAFAPSIKAMQEILVELYSPYGDKYFREQLALLGLLTSLDGANVSFTPEFIELDQQKLASYQSDSDSLRLKLSGL